MSEIVQTSPPNPIKPGTHTSFDTLKQIDAGVLNVGYAEVGPIDGSPVILLHGWPYDIYSFVEVAPILASAGYRVIVPYLRGYGTTSFLSSTTLRNGQPGALALDIIALMDALKIEKAILAGFDWGARTADILAALWPERTKALVAVSGYLIGSQDAGKLPLPPQAELQWWYQFYFATERGRAGYEKYRREFARLIWQIASPQWNFDDVTFERSAASFDNPDHVDIVIHNYRWRLGLANSEPQYDEIEQRLAQFPVITVPTITLEGDANGAPHPDSSVYAKKFAGKYTHRVITGGIGHNLPQEAPQAFAEAIIEVDSYQVGVSTLESEACAGVAQLEGMYIMKVVRFVVVAVVAIIIGGAIVAFVQNKSEVGDMRHSLFNFSGEGSFPSLSGATQWLNSPPLTPDGLRGKVVLVDFWTYTCVNWQRTFPYVRAWAEKYKDQGLVVIGVHTPEFTFEYDLDNVQREVHDLGVDYPVAVDNSYGVWNAFNNNYWPALFLIDAKGQIRYHQFGEGSYEQSEMMIQQLLTEAGSQNVRQSMVSVNPTGLEVAADWDNLRSGENYLGYNRTQGFASPGDAILGESHVYAVPDRFFLNDWALSGDWTVQNEYVQLNQPNGKIVYRFHARDVNLVMGPATAGMSVRFRVRIDGQAPGTAHGADVDDEGNGTVTEQGTYQLIRQPQPITDRTVEIEFLDAGIEAYDFTVG